MSKDDLRICHDLEAEQLLLTCLAYNPAPVMRRVQPRHFCYGRKGFNGWLYAAMCDAIRAGTSQRSWVPRLMEQREAAKKRGIHLGEAVGNILQRLRPERVAVVTPTMIERVLRSYELRKRAAQLRDELRAIERVGRLWTTCGVEGWCGKCVACHHSQAYYSFLEEERLAVEEVTV